MGDPDEQVEGGGLDADRDEARGEAPASARVPLSHRRIVEAAVVFIDDHGLTDLTMRRLAQSLGVEAMSLYRYVPGREVLLDEVVEVLVAELSGDRDVVGAAPEGWQEYLQQLAHGIREIALRHPRAFSLFASRPTQAPWLLPPVRSLEWVEMFLAAMTAKGFSSTSAVTAYRAFASFLLGHLLLETATSGVAQVALDAFPTVATLSAALAEDHSAAEFEEALENLLDRLRLLRTA